MFVFSNTFIVLLPFAAYSLWLAACEERAKRTMKEKMEMFHKIKKEKPYPRPLPSREGSDMILWEY